MTILRVAISGLALSMSCVVLHGQAVSKPSTFQQPEAPAQTDVTSPAVSNSGKTLAASQAPDEMTNKITDLVHAGKYAEAQKLTDGLLIAYPDDQRLVRAKALIEKLRTSGYPGGQATGTTSETPSMVGASAVSLTGMDKIDYNGLLELARQAQQTTDLAEQTKLLHQFMSQSRSFLQKHPEQMLIWQLRAASSMSLNEPTQGYEAGQALIAAGAADSSDPSLQRLLGQLRNKGWLDKDIAVRNEKAKQFAWLLGTWNVSWRWWWGDVNARDREQFVMADSGIEGYLLDGNGVRNAEPDFRIAILDSGELKWEDYLPAAETGDMYVFRHIGGSLIVKILIGRRSDPNGYFGNHRFDHGLLYSASTGSQQFYPSGWQPVVSAVFDKAMQRLTIAVTPQDADSKSHSKFFKENPVTLFLTKDSSSPSELAQ